MVVGEQIRRTWTLALLTSTLSLGAPGAVGAFHERGSANCNGCHVSHPGGDGSLAGPSADAGLLIAESPTDVCLLCHAESLGAVLGADPLAPPPERGAGNFVFLLEDNLNDAPDGSWNPIPGDAAGHNLVAPGHGLSADPRHAVAPGGSYPASRMGCTSCHDPHGNENFRMLHSSGRIASGDAVFSRPAPDAVGVGLDSAEESPGHHTAYRSGMSEWCGNCHGRYHEGSGGSAFAHPVDHVLGTGLRERYALYDGDANPVGGDASRAYLPEVPFEDPASGPSSSAQPGVGSRVMCLSCHRAHASSAPAAGRWDFNVERLADDGRASGSHPLSNPYRDAEQGGLCAKCHGETAAGAEDPAELLRSWQRERR